MSCYRGGTESKFKKAAPSHSTKKNTVQVSNHHSSSLYSPPDSNSYFDQRTFNNFELSSRHSDIGSRQDRRQSIESVAKKKQTGLKDKEKDIFRMRSENELPHLPDVVGLEGTSKFESPVLLPASQPSQTRSW